MFRLKGKSARYGPHASSPRLHRNNASFVSFIRKICKISYASNQYCSSRKFVWRLWKETGIYEHDKEVGMVFFPMDEIFWFIIDESLNKLQWNSLLKLNLSSFRIFSDALVKFTAPYLSTPKRKIQRLIFRLPWHFIRSKLDSVFAKITV